MRLAHTRIRPCAVHRPSASHRVVRTCDARAQKAACAGSVDCPTVSPTKGKNLFRGKIKAFVRNLIEEEVKMIM